MAENDWRGMAVFLLDRCCLIRREFFGDDDGLFFNKDQGNWEIDSKWAGPGLTRRIAYDKGLINANWYCFSCLASHLPHAPDFNTTPVQDIRAAWTQRNAHRAVAMKKFRKSQRRAQGNLSRQQAADSMPDLLDVDRDYNTRIEQLIQDLQAAVRLKRPRIAADWPL